MEGVRVMINVVIVEDNPVDSRIAENYFSACLDKIRLMSFKTLAASEKALLRADLVVLDYYLQECDGIHSIGIVKQLNPTASIIVISGTQSVEIARILGSMGVSLYLPKILDDSESRNAVTKSMVCKVASIERLKPKRESMLQRLHEIMHRGQEFEALN